MAKAPKTTKPTVAPQSPAHAAEMARREANRVKAKAQEAAAKKANDAEMARRLNNRLGRGTK